MPVSTGFATIFDLVKYRDGFLVKYPSKSEPDVIKQNKDTLKLISALNEYNEINKLMRINTVHRLNQQIRQGKLKEIDWTSEIQLANIIDRFNDDGSIIGLSLQTNHFRMSGFAIDNYLWW